MTENKIILIKALKTVYLQKRSEYMEARAKAMELEKELAKLEIDINDLTGDGFLKINDIPKEY